MTTEAKTMRTIWTLTLNTFKEGIRAKVLYNLVFFALLIITFSYFLGQLSLGENQKIMMDFGLSSMSLFGVLVAIFVGIGIIYKEIERRTIYTILSKPIERWQFIVGKYCGLSLILFVQLICTWTFFSLLMWVYSHAYPFALLPAVFFIFIELLVITAVAIFFSSFSSPFLSALFTISIFIIGHSTDDLLLFANKTGSVVLINMAGLFNSVLDFSNFNLTTEVVHGMPVSWSWMFNVLAYGLSLVVLLLLMSSLIFRTRDFK